MSAQARIAQLAPQIIARFSSAVWRFVRALSRFVFRRRLRAAPFSLATEKPVLNYGGAHGAGGSLHGGRVKLTHLAERFPESASQFNVLYLVSSAPPEHALDLVEWAKSRGVKFVWNQNGVAYPAWRGARCEEINAPMRELRRRADFIFYQSQFCRECANRFLGTSAAPSEIAFNCVDTAHFKPAPSPANRLCRLLAAGSHHESYRIFSALETAAELVARRFPVELKIAGRLAWPGAEREVREKIRALGVVENVRVGGIYNQREAPAIYQSADILLHVKYKDPCPTVPIEAMACGVPVIGSASGGLPELVSERAGVLCAVPESWEENHWPESRVIADAVETIMAHWNEFSAGARREAETRFSKEAWLAKHERVFEGLVGT